MACLTAAAGGALHQQYRGGEKVRLRGGAQNAGPGPALKAAINSIFNGAPQAAASAQHSVVFDAKLCRINRFGMAYS